MQQILSCELWLQVILGLFVATWIIQLIYIFRYFGKLSGRVPEPINRGNDIPVSVIICARNEEKNLREHIPVLMEQDYPEFEVIVVNDSSWDDTDAILNAFHVHYPNLRIVTLDEEKQNLQGKKFALTLGIKAAKYDTLLLTDADCVPASRDWIRLMTSQVQEDTSIVLGFSPYRRYPGWLNKIIRFDTLMIGLHYLGFARAGQPYMGVGRNLCYRKEVFFSVGGFKAHYTLASGDDDLFINQVANRKNTAVSYTPDAQTVSEPHQSWKSWFTQKRRHLTTSSRYKPVHQNLLGLWPMTFGLMLASFGVLMFFHIGMLLVGALLFVRYVVMLTILHGGSKNLGQQRDLVWLSPFLELHLFVLNVGLYFTNLVRKPQKWN